MTIDLDPQAAAMSARHLTAACFMIAAICALPARRGWLAGLMSFGAVESYALWRFEFHNWVQHILEGLFPGRTHFEMQNALIAIAALPAVALIVVYLLSLRRATPGQRIVRTGGMAMLAMLAVEMVSRDDIVAHVYRRIGPFAIITWWIAASALIIAAGCLVEVRARRAAGEGRAGEGRG